MRTPGIDDLERDEQECDRQASDIDAADAPWPNALPLEPPPPPEFPIDALSPVLASQVEDVARVTQVPADLPGAVALGVIGACGARRAVVAVGTTHVEPLCVYFAAVAPSGTRKSAALAAMLTPLRDHDRRRQREAEPEICAAVERRKLAEARLDSLRKQQARPTVKAEERERLCAEAETLARTLPAVPALPRQIVDDRTPEALARELERQQGAVLLASAEGADLFAIAAGRYARDGGDQATIYLHAYDGERIDVDRITRDAVRVEDPALSIIITPQPVVIERLAEHPELHHRGLVPRFAFVIAPDLAGMRIYDEAAAPDEAVGIAYATMLDRLLALPRAADRASTHRLQIAGAALDAWRAYHDRVERDLGDGGPLAPIREWSSKQVGRVARIAGALHLVQTVGAGTPWRNDIAAATVEAACRIGSYLEAHALVAYGVMRADPRLRIARAILRWLLRTRAERMTERDALVYAVSHGAERSPEDVATACALLVEYGWLRRRPDPPRRGPGRHPSPAYAVHPVVAAGTKIVDSVDNARDKTVAI